MTDNRPVVRWANKLTSRQNSMLWRKARLALLDAGKKDEYEEMQKRIFGQNRRETLEIMKCYVKFEGPFITNQQSEARR